MARLNLSDEIVAQINTVFTTQGDEPFIHGSDSIFKVSQLVAHASGIRLQPAPSTTAEVSLAQQLNAITQASQIRYRKVQLSGEWWKNDCGSLIVVRVKDKVPCALISSNTGSYKLIDPENETEEQLTPELAATLEDIAFYLYRPLPDGPLNFYSIIQFCKKGIQFELKQLVLLQFLLSIIGLFTPIAMGMLFSDAVPNADQHLLWQISAVLLAGLIVSTVCKFSQYYTLLRFRFKVNISLQAAIIDRMLKLPLRFFSNYDAGDLASRVEGIDQIQKELSNSLLITLFSIVSVLLSLILMFIYSPLLAFIAMALAVINLVVNVSAILLQLQFLRGYLFVNGKYISLILQFLTNLTKLRSSNAESESFRVWSPLLISKNKLLFKNYRISNALVVFNTIYRILTIIILFALVSYVIELDLGSFITFYAAFTEFFSGLLAIAAVVDQLLKIVPLYERTRPILGATLENRNQAIKNITVTGKIDIKNISFRYEQSTPYILHNISLSIAPGSMIALVGPSGGGKTSLFKLLLGFERPDTGHILFDDLEISKLDLLALRRQLGVVLQNNFLLTGTILEAIIGNSDLGLEDAWNAAILADLAKDIEAMPMGMETIISEGGGTLSAGQRQRLLIARAIIHQPKILLLDEATSALDNITQATIQHNLTQLKMTRIIVAHRLSTVRHADQIYVFNNGVIEQHGTYASLINAPGLFAQFANRQLT
ncbi:MAG: NHLP bacteriocin export ABC transporter permease/ATPase subunit [Legionella sp.]|uniref:NHLP bacteriocin export ABC transporter permease/ATPase subunit n=1 Tax=Legionella sp. TaxID=459 RepID=UPI002840B037|nr:NHLP bacteriocin export ABC transporter permease/ATPase subunit [Legionella sp.]